VPVDCGALPESIFESELFGHERGAFTGAIGAQGLFRMSSGGTLFLDEIGELPVSVQVKLLRALQNKEVRPVGGGSPVPVDLRVVSATHRDLAAMVETQGFRMDLFYRLNVVRIEIPPLRERMEDLPLLVQHFLDQRRHATAVEGVGDDALDRLCAHHWPGNVRELENVLESALALARGPWLRAADLPLGRGRRAATPAGAGREVEVPAGLPLSLDAYERAALERALREAGGNATEAAKLVGIGRSTFYRKVGKHGLGEPS
jgi:transcriptional regulator with PAS, ATPase and Fis domain